jgi:Leucine-rich repeat (LRR) protein
VQCANGRITKLDMANQGLPGSGGIPLALMDLTGLKSLNLGGNKLKGTIPSTIGQLTELNDWLEFCGNQLTGSIPNTIGQLTGLILLGFDVNQLDGSIPSSIGQLVGLAHLGLGSNQFTGTVPQELLQLKKLNFIGLDTNPHLTGKLPAFDFGQFTVCCAMGGDPFTCPLPAGANITCVCPSHKELPPPTCIPSCTGSSANLTPNDCSAWQRFTRDPLYTKWAEGRCGSKVHTDPCSCTTTVLECANGRITRLGMGTQSGAGLPSSGGIPLALMDLTGLTFLSFYGSHIVGTIPAAFTQLKQLEYLSLKGNSLTGQVPSWLAGLKQLTGISIGANMFSGVLPKFNFSQYKVCCEMTDQLFACPLPPGAATCAGTPGGGGPCHSSPPPMCQ